MAIITDIVDGATLEHDSDGYHVSRKYVISELSGNADARLYSALQTAGIPQRGDYHPTIPGLRVNARSASALGPTEAEVTISYVLFSFTIQPPEPGQPAVLETGSTVTEVETTKDVNGTDLVLTHDGYEPQGGLISKQVPQTILRFSRKEDSDPETKSLLFTGKINSGTFRQDPPKYWLCTGITGRSDDGGATYDVQYEFQRNSGTWDATIVFTDPNTDKPIAEPVEGESIKTVQVYELADFNQLNLGV